MSKEVHEMFTCVRLRNFMSFRDVIFDFRNGKNGIKKFVSIYGENGSGKSNFVNSIHLLLRSLDSFNVIANTEVIDKILDTKQFPKELYGTLLGNMSISREMRTCRMVECEEPTSVEYSFKFNGYTGYYYIAFEEKFIHEKLYYYTGKQHGTLFEIRYNNGKVEKYFSNKLFLNNKVKTELEDEISKFWGKHTVLSILNKERKEKNEQYIQESYLNYIFDILDMLQEVTIHCQKASNYKSELCAKKPSNMLESLDEGEIDEKLKHLLDHSEKILRDFFTQTYADIKDVFYEQNIVKGKIRYKLFVKKMIGGKLRTIDFSKESAGTQHILEIIRDLLGVFCGVIVVYDEIDDGIHDLLLKTILTSMIDDITGQLIITTHNTYMMETIDIKSVYVITGDYNGDKEVRCLNDYPRIQGTNNPRVMYLKGLFGGIPIVDIVDYDSILEELKDV